MRQENVPICPKITSKVIGDFMILIVTIFDEKENVVALQELMKN